MLLTNEMLKWGLYCTSPTGVRQLLEHLHNRNVTVDEPDLLRLLREWLAADKIHVKSIQFGGVNGFSVDLFALPGHGI